MPWGLPSALGMVTASTPKTAVSLQVTQTQGSSAQGASTSKPSHQKEASLYPSGGVEAPSGQEGGPQPGGEWPQRVGSAVGFSAHSLGLWQQQGAGREPPVGDTGRCTLSFPGSHPGPPLAVTPKCGPRRMGQQPTLPEARCPGPDSRGVTGQGRPHTAFCPGELGRPGWAPELPESSREPRASGRRAQLRGSGQRKARLYYQNLRRAHAAGLCEGPPRTAPPPGPWASSPEREGLGDASAPLSGPPRVRPCHQLSSSAPGLLRGLDPGPGGQWAGLGPWALWDTFLGHGLLQLASDGGHGRAFSSKTRCKGASLWKLLPQVEEKRSDSLRDKKGAREGPPPSGPGPQRPLARSRASAAAWGPCSPGGEPWWPVLLQQFGHRHL